MTIFTVSGDFVFSCLNEIRKIIKKEMANSDTDKFLMNLSEVKKIDSAGIGFIVSIYKSVLSRKGNYALVSPNKVVNYALHTVGLTRLFKIYGTEDEAIEVFNS